MGVRTVFEVEEVAEETTNKYLATLVDEDEVAIAASGLTTLTLTHYLEGSLSTIINNRDGQDVFNTNNVTVDSNGLLTWLLQPEDTVISDSSNTVTENHIALFEYTWSSGTKAGKHEIKYTVLNLTGV